MIETKPKEIKQLFKLDFQDQLKSVVRGLDSFENTICYGGYDKVLKIIKLNQDGRQNYEIVNKFYLEGLPIVNCRFID